MKGTKKGIVLALFMGVFGLGVAHAEPGYLLYPSGPAVFRFDASRYELVSSDHPKFVAEFAIGNQMLWDRVANRVPVEIYRAPLLTGFEPSGNGTNEFVTYGGDFSIVVDGFGTSPRTLGNLCLRFWPEPSQAVVSLVLDGRVIDGLTAHLPSLEVSSPVATGFYADTQSHTLAWVGATAVRIIAFSDKDGDGAFDGTPPYSILARDATVPASTSTWGSIKAMYR